MSQLNIYEPLKATSIMVTRRNVRTSLVTILLPLSLTSSLELESLPQRRKRVKRKNSTTIDDSNSIMNSLIAEPAVEIRSGLLSEYWLIHWKILGGMSNFSQTWVLMKQKFPWISIVLLNSHDNCRLSWIDLDAN